MTAGTGKGKGGVEDPNNHRGKGKRKGIIREAEVDQMRKDTSMTLNIGDDLINLINNTKIHFIRPFSFLYVSPFAL